MIKIIRATTKEQLEAEYNKFCKENKVYATQSHIACSLEGEIRSFVTYIYYQERDKQ